MIVMLMASLLIVGATPAAGANLAWSNMLTLPSALTGQLLNGSNVTNVTVAPNGDLFAIDSADANGDLINGNVVYKSTDGGTMWTPSLAVAATFVDLAVSPSYATDATVVAIAAGPPAQAYISTNGGATFAVLGGAVPVATEIGTSIAIAPNYAAGVGEVMIGTADNTAAAGAPYGKVYIWGYGGVLNWTAANINAGAGADITDVAYSPNYLIDATRLAVGSDAVNGTLLHTHVSTDGFPGITFDVTLGAVAIVDANSLDFGAAVAAPAGPIVGSDIALPSDFNASSPFNRSCYVSTQGGATTDNVYRVTVGTGAAGVALNPYASLGIALPADQPIQSIAHSGTYTAGRLYAGDTATTTVFVTSNPTLPLGFTTWTFCLAAPSGAGTTYVALAVDFATSSTMYAGTTGANSALSVSNDGGLYFHQTGLIATVLNAITDFVAASASEMYLITSDLAGPPGMESLWKSVDGGVTWYRVLSIATAANNAQVRLSQSYAADSTLVFINVGAAVAAPPAPSQFYVSNNSGATWAGRNIPTVGFTIADMVIVDQYIFYAGNAAAASVQGTINGGWTWQPAATALILGAPVNDMAYDSTTGHIMVGCTNGLVYISTNANVSYVAQGAGVGGAAIVAYDPGYSANSIIYGADSTGVAVAGIQRFNTSTPLVPWAVIDGGATLLPTDIVLASDGTMYASDRTATAGIQRSLNPTFAVVPLIAFEAVAAADGLAAGSVIGVLSLVEGSNIIYAINSAAAPLGPTISTYTDILTTAVPTVTSPAEGDVVLAAAAAVAIDPIPNNPTGTYQVQWNTRADYRGVGNVIAIPAVVNAVNLNTAAIPVPAGATIYLRVQATGPVFGPWSASISFETQLVPAAPNAPGIIPAAGGNGNTGPGGFNVPLQPTFSWGTVGGATGYELIIATDPGMTDLIVDLTGANALGNVSTYALTGLTLEYSTTYYWQVRGISATSETQWSPITSFTTMAEPVETPPPVTVTDTTITVDIPEQPTPTTTIVTIEPPAEEKISEGYIYAIIIIGAVLVIAVIVLIVRTRRSV